MKSSQPVLRLTTLRNIEQRHNTDSPLMERAGEAAFKLATQLLKASALPPLIIAGPGNNGGDAFVVARLLKKNGSAPIVVFSGEAAKLPKDACAAHDAWIAAGGVLHNEIPSGKYGLAIDGLFGIGLKRPVDGHHAILIKQLNALGCPLLALDIPSGLDSETGRVLGIAVLATHTITFIALKTGLLTLDGPDHCGQISVDDLGLNIDTTDGFTISPTLFAEHLKPRLKNSHKGSYGSVGILGGAPGMTGAALLAGRAALRHGAGRVFVGLLEKISVDPLQPELMLRDADEVLSLATCLAIGPGLGQSDGALSLLRRAIETTLPLLLDADALNLLATHPVLANNLARRSAATLLTPHPAEAARLLGCDIATVQANRLAAALTLAHRFQAATLLKGNGSIIALPNGRWYINTTGNPCLATAGSGDVLSGMTIALLAQGWAADNALLAATHLHGAAADACVAAGDGPLGVSAGDLIHPARKLLNLWIAARDSELKNDFAHRC